MVREIGRGRDVEERSLEMIEVSRDIKLVDSIASFNKKASLIALSHDSSACMKAPSKEIYRKQTICDSLSTVNGNRGRIKLTYPFAR